MNETNRASFLAALPRAHGLIGTAFALIMATQRRLVELANWVRDGEWQTQADREHFGIDVRSKTLGIVGAR